jgi:hypothetical protein
MKTLATILFAALMISTSSTVSANIISTTEPANIAYSMCCTEGGHPIHAHSAHEFRHFVNRGQVDILISGDGSTDLDLYVYIGGEWEISDGDGDDEKVCLSNIVRSGFITIRIVNRGDYTNKYSLKIK